MNWFKNIERFFLKVEAFFSNLDFIARLAKALSVGVAAMNDSLLNRNTDALKTYLDARDATKPDSTEAEKENKGR